MLPPLAFLAHCPRKIWFEPAQYCGLIPFYRALANSNFARRAFGPDFGRYC
jgi:hypothetical protein